MQTCEYAGVTTHGERDGDDDVDASLKAIAYPRRRQLLRVVGDGERSVGELAEATGLTQPATSQHLRVLRQAGLVEVRTDANRRLYRVGADRVAEVQAAVADLWAGPLERLVRHAEARARRPASTATGAAGERGA